MRITRADIREAKEDINLLSLAIKEMWPISDDMRQQLIEQQMAIVNNPLLSPDTKSAAAANIIRASVANLKALDTIIKLGLAAQQTQQHSVVIASDNEIANGLSELINDAGHGPDKIENEQTTKKPWNLENVG